MTDQYSFKLSDLSIAFGILNLLKKKIINDDLEKNARC